MKNFIWNFCFFFFDSFFFFFFAVQRLPSTFVLPFLKSVIDKFQSKPSRGLTLITWIRALLIQHTSYLMTVPDLVKSLSVLYLTVDSRVTVFKKLLKLSGRLDLLLSQVGFVFFILRSCCRIFFFLDTFDITPF